jgi:hypothetical protein
MLAKSEKPATSSGKPTTAGTLLTSGMTAAAGIIGISWISTAEGPPESDSDVHIKQKSAVVIQQHSAGTSSTAAETHYSNIRADSSSENNLTDVNSRRETRNRSEASNK